MKIHPIKKTRASILIVALLIIASLGLTIAAYYRGVVPKFRGTHQGVAWNESLQGADAGVDLAISTLNSWAGSTTDPAAYPAFLTLRRCAGQAAESSSGASARKPPLAG